VRLCYFASKKPGLVPTVSANFRPIYNLNNTSEGLVTPTVHRNHVLLAPSLTDDCGSNFGVVTFGLFSLPTLYLDI